MHGEGENEFSGTIAFVIQGRMTNAQAHMKPVSRLSGAVMSSENCTGMGKLFFLGNIGTVPITFR